MYNPSYVKRSKSDLRHHQGLMTSRLLALGRFLYPNHSIVAQICGDYRISFSKRITPQRHSDKKGVQYIYQQRF